MSRSFCLYSQKLNRVIEQLILVYKSNMQLKDFLSSIYYYFEFEKLVLNCL